MWDPAEHGKAMTGAAAGRCRGLSTFVGAHQAVRSLQGPQLCHWLDAEAVVGAQTRVSEVAQPKGLPTPTPAKKQLCPAGHLDTGAGSRWSSLAKERWLNWYFKRPRASTQQTKIYHLKCE